MFKKNEKCLTILYQKKKMLNNITQSGLNGKNMWNIMNLIELVVGPRKPLESPTVIKKKYISLIY